MGIFQLVDHALRAAGPRDGDYLTVRQLIALKLRYWNLSAWHDWRRAGDETRCAHREINYDAAQQIYWCSACPWRASERQRRAGEIDFRMSISGEFREYLDSCMESEMWISGEVRP